MKKLILTAALFSLLLVAPIAHADSGQYGQYGPGTPSQSILIDKTVGKGTSQTKGGTTDVTYVDNFSASDPRFKPEEMVFFRLKVKNTSGDKLTNVTVKDFLPSYIEPVEGPGTYDSTNRVITYSAGDFAAGEEKTFYLKMQVTKQANLPADRGIMCVVNKAQAYNDKANDDDSSQFCIEKTVQGVSTVPSTGPELGLILMGANALMFATGIFLKKRV